jgi:hypothetical protein
LAASRLLTNEEAPVIAVPLAVGTCAIFVLLSLTDRNFFLLIKRKNPQISEGACFKKARAIESPPQLLMMR